MIDPKKHPRRFAAQQERQIAERGKALAIGMTAIQASKQIGVKVERLEQIAAKFGFAFQPYSKRY